MKAKEKKREKQLKVEEFKERMKTEEQQRIRDRLEEVDSKLAASNARNRDCLINRQETVRRRNQSLSEKLTMFRTQEQMTLEQTIEGAKQKEQGTT